MENLFMPLENNRPFLKCAFEGFAGDGKTFTAAQMAIGVHKLIGSIKPIAVVDTERAMDKLKFLFDAADIKVQTTTGRTLATVNQAIKACEDGFADILIIDSITHVWESYLQAYMDTPNQYGKTKHRLEFQDWGIIKPKWKKEFSEKFVQSNVHIIFTGRAGYSYEDEKDENGKRQIVKSGIKMKAENETQFEPDLLILMQKRQNFENDVTSIWREATILKDRTTVIDSKTFKNPTFEDFFPAIKQLLNGTISDVHGGEIPDKFEDFESKFSEKAKRISFLTGEIEGCFNVMGLSTGAKDKQFKAWTLDKIFGVKAIDNLPSVTLGLLENGHNQLKTYARKYADYLSQCLDSDTQPDPGEAAKMMQEVLKPELNFN